MKITIATAKLIAAIIKPLTKTGTITYPEDLEVRDQLKQLARTGSLMPVETPHLMTTEEVAKRLNVGVSNLKKMLKEGTLPLT